MPTAPRRHDPDREPTPLAEALPETEATALPAAPEFDLDAWGQQYLREAIRRTRVAYFEANCPPDYREINLDHPSLASNREAVATILGWQFGPKGILASGHHNRGKTRAMFALCRRLLCDEGRDVGIWQAQHFFAELQAQVSYGSDYATGFIERQAARPILFIDDFGQHSLLTSREDWAKSWFFALLDERMKHRRPILMTTNLSAKQMAAGQTDDQDIRGNALVRRLLAIAEPVTFKR